MDAETEAMWNRFQELSLLMARCDECYQFLVNTVVSRPIPTAAPSNAACSATREDLIGNKLVKKKLNSLCARHQRQKVSVTTKADDEENDREVVPEQTHEQSTRGEEHHTAQEPTIDCVLHHGNVHYTQDRSLFTSFREWKKPLELGHGLQAYGIGETKLTLRRSVPGDDFVEVLFKETLFVPKACVTGISLVRFPGKATVVDGPRSVLLFGLNGQQICWARKVGEVMVGWSTGSWEDKQAVEEAVTRLSKEAKTFDVSCFAFVK